MKKRIIATSSIAVALFLSSFISSQAAAYSFPRPRVYSDTQNVEVSDAEPDYAGVSAGDFREELGIDPVFLDSLVRQGFNSSQIQKIFTSAPIKKDHNKLPLSE